MRQHYDDALTAELRRRQESIEDARRYACHLEAEIARARAIYKEHSESSQGQTHLMSYTTCTACRIARVFGWDDAE